MAHHPAPARLVLAHLQPLVPVLFKAAEAGALHAAEYFDAIAKAPEPYLFSTLFRYQARETLAGLGHQAEYDLDDERNLALHLRFRPELPTGCAWTEYKLRIRKAHQGAAPVPGPSRAARAFYVQTSLPGLEMDATNLLVLWDVTRAWALQPYLVVACPIGTAPFGSRVPCAWQVPLQAPAFTAPPQLDDGEDLPLVYEDVLEDDDASQEEL